MTPAQIKALREAWPVNRHGTHWAGCETVHYACAIQRLIEAYEVVSKQVKEPQ